MFKPPRLWTQRPSSQVAVFPGPGARLCPVWGALVKRAERPPSLPLCFLLVYFPFLALWSLHILISHPCSLHLRVQKCGFQSKGHLENNYTTRLQVEIPVFHRTLREGILSSPEMPSPSSSWEPPHFTIMLRWWWQDLALGAPGPHLLTLSIHKDKSQACAVGLQGLGPCLRCSWSSLQIRGGRRGGREDPVDCELCLTSGLSPPLCCLPCTYSAQVADSGPGNPV